MAPAVLPSRRGRDQVASDSTMPMPGELVVSSSTCAGGGPVVGAADADLEGRHLRLEVVLVAGLRRHAEAVVVVAVQRRLHQDLARVVGVQAQLQVHGAFVEAALALDGAAARHRHALEHVVHAPELADVVDLADRGPRGERVVAGRGEGRGLRRLHLERGARAGEHVAGAADQPEAGQAHGEVGMGGGDLDQVDATGLRADRRESGAGDEAVLQGLSVETFHDERLSFAKVPGNEHTKECIRCRDSGMRCEGEAR
jgi:hypothetical protein